MLTNNAKILMRFWLIFSGTWSGYTGCGVVDVDGNTTSSITVDGPLFTDSVAHGYNVSWASDICCRLKVGTGNSAATAADYKLESEIDSSTLSLLSQNSSVSLRSGECRCDYRATYQNVSSEAVTISEIGLVRKCSSTFLLAREVLDTPITVEPNGTCTVTMMVEV